MDDRSTVLIIDMADPLPVTDAELALIEAHFGAILADFSFHDGARAKVSSDFNGAQDHA